MRTSGPIILLCCSLTLLIASPAEGSEPIPPPRDIGHYLIAAPSTVLGGSRYDVSVDILHTTVPDETEVDVEATLLASEYNMTAQRYDLVEKHTATGSFGMGSPGKLSMEIGANFDCPQCRLQVRGRGGLEFQDSVFLSVTSSPVSILVQTDKAIYKPGQIVRYRILAVYPNLQVYTGRFNIAISDPRHNKVRNLVNVTSTGGIVEGSLALSEQPLFGEWSMSVSSQDVWSTAYQRFTVAQYELPRFEVTVELAPYGLTNQDLLVGKVKAKYTFGQAVEGRVELHVGPNRGPNSCGELPDTVQSTFEIDGEASFSVPREDFARALGYIGDGTEVRVTAFVKESATGVRLNGTSVIRYHSNEYNIKFLDNTPNVFKPGLPYTAFFQVSTPDDMPPTGSTNRLVSVYTTAHYTSQVPDQHLYGIHEFTGTYPLPGQNVTLPASGILPVNIHIPANATKISVKATFGTVSTNKDIESAYSIGNTFLQLTLLGHNIKANTQASFQVKGTEPLNGVKFMVLARGSMVASGSVDGDGEMTFNFNLNVTHVMAPTAHILVYYSSEEKGIIADSLAFNVEGIFQNNVSVSFNKNSSQPAQDITLAVRADPESTVCVLAVDQSVLLLKSGNDITPDKVGKEISRYDKGQTPSDSEFALSYSSKDTSGVFESVGLKVISDISLADPRPPPMYSNSPALFGAPRGQSFDYDMDMPDEIGSGIRPIATPARPAVAKVKRIRQLFPEAWLWLRAEAGANGRVEFTSTVPDTITSWVASAFAVNPTSGLGVAPGPTKLRVFKPFFVSLNLPSTVVRGEKIVIVATVFNYLPSDVEVTVTLRASRNYTYVREEYVPVPSATGDIVANIQVAEDSQGVVYFPIQTTQLGVVPIEVTAQTESAADGVRRNIVVKPEGAPVSYNTPIFVQNAGPDNVTRTTVTLSTPSSAVEGSTSARAKVTGDLIGASLTNLQSLLNLPTGCGEQSLVKFAPTVYVYKYLQATGQLTNAYKNQMERSLESGYQRQLTYQRSDGGFSAFGNRDAAGSTWLTAMVVKSFLEARDVIYIDNDVITKGLNFLFDKQSEDGSFQELGRVLDPSVQGSSSRATLSAHVLLALLPSRQLYKPERLQACDSQARTPVYDRDTCTYLNATRAAIRYLDTNVNAVNNKFSLAVISLALAKAGSTHTQETLQRLRDMAREEGELVYWSDSATTSDQPTRRGSVYLSTWAPPTVQARPLDVLISSYAVMAYIQQNQLQQALPVVRWLVKQRNAKGGFVSSQDTTVAVEALSKFASDQTIPEDKDMQVQITPSGSEVPLEFRVTRQNGITLQTQELPRGGFSPVTPDVSVEHTLGGAPDDGEHRHTLGGGNHEDYHRGARGRISGVNLEVTGAGTTLVEFDVRFNVQEELTTPSFGVSTVLLDDDIDKFNLMVCTKWTLERQTGMVVQEVSIPSGFEPDLSSMNDVAGVKKSERRGDIVEVYFDEITKTSLCYSVMMTRSGKVANTQKNYIRTYDYYTPADQSTVFYQPQKLRDATVCDVCDGCCVTPDSTRP